ncbi:MAG: M56 family metallopeptidase, partial [Pirellulales bacterium]|nr:M56 family metallopeptidase [Pirellulales bacterium]
NTGAQSGRQRPGQWQVQVHVEAAENSPDQAGQLDSADHAGVSTSSASPVEMPRLTSSQTGALPVHFKLGPVNFELGLALCFVGWQGLALLILTLRWRYFVKQITASSTVVEGRARGLLNQICRRRGRKLTIRLLESEHQQQPIAFGCLRPTILLPAGIESQLSEEELSAVLSHEVAHICRRDQWWLLFGRALVACFPFQPLHFLAKRQWLIASEYLCDQWAIERGVKALTLARSLTKMVSWQLGQRPPQMALSAVGRRSTVIGRVAKLVDGSGVEKSWGDRQRYLFFITSLLLAAAFSLVAPSVRWAHATGPAMFEAQPAGQVNSLPPVAAGDPWSQLNQDIESLQRDWDRAGELLSRRQRSPQIEQIQRAIEHRMSALMRRQQTLQQEFAKELNE